MILSDNETKIDLLNNEAIAQTVLALIKESNDQPISIGIHGDWGAGKSSILEMIENAIDSEADGKRYSCIRFNGWRHQGFEDSKIALMSSIISELNKKEKLGAKSEKILKKLWKNINWMNIAKTAGKTAVGIATGTAPITILSSALDVLKNATTTKDGVDAAIDAIGGYLKESKITEDTSSNKEFTEFQENFSELLDDAKIDKLVVLIDDLDRCLPDVTISTLEAVRLFMFTEKTAFVIAADESMIRYAVKKHFPDVINENKINAGDTFADKYLEKLIRAAMYKAFGKDGTVYTENSIAKMQKKNSEGMGIQLRSFEYAIDKIKKNPKCVSLYIHKPGPLPRNEEYLKELGDVYKRGLLEVDGFIQEYIKQEGENDDL